MQFFFQNSLNRDEEMTFTKMEYSYGNPKSHLQVQFPNFKVRFQFQSKLSISMYGVSLK